MDPLTNASEQPLTRTDVFLPADDIDELFVSPQVNRASSWVASALLVALFCAILSFV